MYNVVPFIPLSDVKIVRKWRRVHKSIPFVDDVRLSGQQRGVNNSSPVEHP